MCRSTETLADMNARVTTLSSAGAVLVVIAQSSGLFFGGSPSILSPLPLPLVLPMLLGLPALAALLIFVVLFLVWRPSLLSGDPDVPVRTLILYTVMGALSAVWYILGWKYGIEYEGHSFTLICALASAACFLIVGFSLWRARVEPTFYKALIFQTLLFAWLGSYAFPYLGELP